MQMQADESADLKGKCEECNTNVIEQCFQWANFVCQFFCVLFIFYVVFFFSFVRSKV